jgi:hypothetical protein
MLLAMVITSFCCSASAAASEQDVALSWAGTALMTLEQWRKEAVPTAFAKQMLARTRTELDKQTDKLRDDATEDDAAALRELDLLTDLPGS